MRALARLVLLAALPAFAGRWRGAGGEVWSVTEAGGSGAGGPEFAPASSLLVATLGSDAELECPVRRLGDKAVSWVRSRDLQILSHAGAVFTADARVSARASRAGSLSRHALRIARLRASDAGRYECQLNTEPKMSLFFNLTVIDEPMPVAVIAAMGERSVAAAPGGEASLGCEARYEPPPPRALPPLPPLDIHWLKDGQLVDLQSRVGGVSLRTERWVGGSMSRLTLARLTEADAGAYSCATGDVAETFNLHVSMDTVSPPMEAMQRDQSVDNSAASPSHLPLLPVLTITSLLLRALYNT